MITAEELAKEIGQNPLFDEASCKSLAARLPPFIQSRAAGVQGAVDYQTNMDYELQRDAGATHEQALAVAISAAAERLATPQPPKDAGAVPLPKIVGMISDRPICFQDEVARYGNAREAAGRADAVPYEVANNLMLLVEGPGSLRWEDGKGFRLKDTSEWARFYVEVKNAKERATPQHPPAEPAARAQVDGCGACGDGCKARGLCRLADESPHPSPAHAGAGDADAEYSRIYAEAIKVCADQPMAHEIARRLAGGEV